MTWLLWIICGVVFYSFGGGVAMGFISRRVRCRACEVNKRGVVTHCWGVDDHDCWVVAGAIYWPFTLVGWLSWIVLRAAWRAPLALIHAGQRLGTGWQPTDST